MLLDKFYERSAASDIISNEQILIRNSSIDKAEKEYFFPATYITDTQYLMSPKYNNFRDEI